MADKVFQVLFWTWPILLGLVVWLSKSSFAVRFTDHLGNWLATTGDSLRNSPSRIARYWARPTVIVAHSPFAATAAIPDSFLRAGARVAAAPSVGGVLCIVTLIALELAIVGGCFFIMLMIWGFVSSLLSGEKNGGVAENLPLSRVRGSRLVKTGLFGNSPTGTRIDESGRVMKEGFFGDDPNGVRVSEDGRVLEEGFISDSPTGLKINDDGQLVKEGLFGDSPTGTRIDEDGRVVEEGLFGDSPTGYEFEKD
jgi:hypothetical protein